MKKVNKRSCLISLGIWALGVINASSMVGEDESIHLAVRAGENKIYFASSRDRGATWADHGTGHSGIEGWGTTSSPEIIAIDKDMYMFVRGGDNKIYFASSRDRGATWADHGTPLPGWGTLDAPSLAIPVCSRKAFSDQVRFDHAVAQGQYGRAYQMAGDDNHGHMWKEVASTEAKKHLKQLVGASVFEDNATKLVEARTISATFPAEPRAELDLFITAEEAAARATLAGLTPDAAARTAALRSVADRLFG